MLATPSPIDGDGYKLVRDWNFGINVRSLEDLRREFHTRYIYNDGTLDKLNDEWTRYRDNHNHVITENNLQLVARHKGPATGGGSRPLGDGHIESGMIRSKFAFTYGYIEGRFESPSFPGVFPAFWLNPELDGWPPEIDIFEYVYYSNPPISDFPYDPRIVAHIGSISYSHYEDGNPKYASVPWTCSETEGYGKGYIYRVDMRGWHKWGLLWTPEVVRWYLDDQLIREHDATHLWFHTAPQGTGDRKPGGRAHILLNFAIGGSWPNTCGAPRESDFPAALKCDYIRVWRK